MPRPAIVADPGTKLWQAQLKAALDYLATEAGVALPPITAKAGTKLFRAQLLNALQTMQSDYPGGLARWGSGKWGTFVWGASTNAALTELPDVTSKQGAKLFERQLTAALDYIESEIA